LATSLLNKVGNRSVLVFNSTSCVADAGTKERETDPCCNTLVGWDGDCCLPRTVETVEQEYEVSTDTIMEICNQPTCATSYSIDFVEEIIKLKSKASGCSNPFVRPVPTSDALRYSYCRDRYFGTNQTVGIACGNDNDCGKSPSLFIENNQQPTTKRITPLIRCFLSLPSTVDGHCNLITGFCLNSMKRQEERFLECLVQGLDPFTLIYLNDKYDLGSKSTFQTYLKRAWSSKDCVSENEMGKLASSISSTSLRSCLRLSSSCSSSSSSSS
jgi:hypothetical protein